METKRLIVVLGMHRSGSSAIAKSLEVLGVDLGKHLMPADENNEKGYFEDIGINRLNTEILQNIGCDWYSLAPFKNDVFEGERISSLRQKASEIIEDKLQDTNLLGIKDPRLCKLLPFWKNVFDDLELQVSYVICLRNCESIAASLFSRDGIPRVKSLYLWLTHMLPVFQNTKNCQRITIDYDDLILEPRRVLTTIAQQLGLESQIDQDELDRFANDFIDQTLWHHRQNKSGPDEPTPSLVERLNELLGKVSRNTELLDSNDFQIEINAIEEELEDRANLLKYIDLLDSFIIRDHFQLITADKELNSASASLKKKDDLLKSKKKVLTKRNAQIRKLKSAIEEQEYVIDRQGQKIEELERENLAQSSRLESLESTLNNRDATICQLESQLRDEEIRNKKLQKAIETADSDSEELSLQLDQIRSSLFWRLSFISRHFWRIFEALFTARKVRFHLIPENQLQRLRIMDNSWQSSGGDPYFRLVPVSTRLPHGWVRMKTSVQTNPPEQYAKLYLDCGHGENETDAYEIPVLAEGMVDEFVYLPSEAASLRWDPLQNAGTFRQTPITFMRHSWLVRKLRMLSRVVTALVRTPSETREQVGLKWTDIFSGPGRAYVAAGKAIALRLDLRR